MSEHYEQFKDREEYVDDRRKCSRCGTPIEDYYVHCTCSIPATDPLEEEDLMDEGLSRWGKD